MAFNGANFKFIRNVLGEYVVHGGNSSAQMKKHWENNEKLIYYHIYKIQKFEPEPSKLWRKVISRFHLRQVRHFFINGKKLWALRLIMSALINSPSGTINFFICKFRRQLIKHIP